MYRESPEIARVVLDCVQFVLLVLICAACIITGAWKISGDVYDHDMVKEP